MADYAASRRTEYDGGHVRPFKTGAAGRGGASLLDTGRFRRQGPGPAGGRSPNATHQRRRPRRIASRPLPSASSSTGTSQRVAGPMGTVCVTRMPVSATLRVSPPL